MTNFHNDVLMSVDLLKGNLHAAGAIGELTRRSRDSREFTLAAGSDRAVREWTEMWPQQM